MGLRAGLDWCGKSRPTGIRSPNRPARKQSLYRLRYPAHKIIIVRFENATQTPTSTKNLDDGLNTVFLTCVIVIVFFIHDDSRYPDWNKSSCVCLFGIVLNYGMAKQHTSQPMR